LSFGFYSSLNLPFWLNLADGCGSLFFNLCQDYAILGAIVRTNRESGYFNPYNVKRLRCPLEQRRVLQDAKEPEYWIDKKRTYSTHVELTDHILDALARKEIPYGWS
jgi:hypothetical protein